MSIKHSLFLLPILALALLSACTDFDPNAYVPGLYTLTPSPVPSQPASTTTESVSVSATLTVATRAITVVVCTNVPGGKLNVRFVPGDKSDVRGYLAEGEVVTASGEHQDVNGSTWVKLSSPIEGWVNEIYLCEAKP